MDRLYAGVPRARTVRRLRAAYRVRATVIDLGGLVDWRSLDRFPQRRAITMLGGAVSSRKCARGSRTLKRFLSTKRAMECMDILLIERDDFFIHGLIRSAQRGNGIPTHGAPRHAVDRDC